MSRSLQQKPTLVTAAESNTYAPISTQAATVRPAQANTGLIAGTQSGTTVTVVGSTATNTMADTTDFLLGIQSGKFTMSSTNGSLAGFNVQSLTKDMTNKGFVLWCKVDDWTKLSSTTDFQAFTDSSNSVINTRILDGQSVGEAQRQFKAGEWFKLFLPYTSLANIAGTPNRASIAQLRVRFYPQGTTPMTIHFNGFGTYDEPLNTYPNGVVSFTYDDAWASQFTNARTDLDKYGYRATAYPIVDQLGTSGRLTLAQLQSLHDNSGWEVGAHAFTSITHQTGYDKLSVPARQADLAACRKWQLDNGFGDSQSFAYPLGNFDVATIADVKKYWASARTTYSVGAPEVVGTPYPHRMRAFGCGSLTLAQMKTQVDIAKASRAHTIFIFHNLVTSKTSDTNDVLQSDHTALVDYVASQGVAVRPVGEVVRGPAI